MGHYEIAIEKHKCNGSLKKHKMTTATLRSAWPAIKNNIPLIGIPTVPFLLVHLFNKVQEMDPTALVSEG
jgi:hypothetical protein